MQLIAENVQLAGLPTENIPSPCMGVCQLNSQGTHCIGCLRSLEEISGWSRYRDDEKKAVWARLAQRAAQRPLPP